MRSNTLEIRPVGGAVGAEIAGVDLGEPLAAGFREVVLFMGHKRGSPMMPRRFLVRRPRTELSTLHRITTSPSTKVGTIRTKIPMITPEKTLVSVRTDMVLQSSSLGRR